MKIRQIVWDGIGGLKTPNDNTIVQLKYDGSQYHLHIRNCKAFALTSKRESKKTGELCDRFTAIPQLATSKFSNDTKGETIIVTEVVAEHLKDNFDEGRYLDKDGVPIPWDRRSNFVAGCMNRTPDGKKSPLKLIAHDILYLNGVPVHGDYTQRLSMLKRMFPMAGFFGEDIHNDLIYCVDSLPCRTAEDEKTIFSDVLRCELEGIIGRDVVTGKSFKRKGEKTADTILIGYVDANPGKYEGLIGALVLGVWKGTPSEKMLREFEQVGTEKLVENGSIVEVATCSGMGDALRKKFSARRKGFLGEVITVKYANWTGKRLRHPRYVDMRGDQAVKRCTLAHIVEEA